MRHGSLLFHARSRNSLLRLFTHPVPLIHAFSGTLVPPLVQINGTRGNSGPTSGGANIEIGGPNSGQIVEYVKSFDSRSWSCLHVFEGALNCRNTTIRYNDIGKSAFDRGFDVAFLDVNAVTNHILLTWEL